MVELASLHAVFDRTARLLSGIEPEQWEQPTPCSDFDARALAGHLVDFLQTFAAAVAPQRRADEHVEPVEPGAGSTGAERPTQATRAREFRAAADRAIEGWREGAAERLVAIGPDEMPGALAFDLMLVECLAHGWDLAVATGRPAPYTDAQAEAALAAVTPMLTDDSRGPGRQFSAGRARARRCPTAGTPGGLPRPRPRAGHVPLSGTATSG